MSEWNKAPWNSAICAIKRERGEWRALIVESRHNVHSQKIARWPAGKAKPQDKGKPLWTGKREFKEETGVRLKPNAKIIMLESYEIDDEHTQHFFAALYEDCIGNLRSSLKIEESGALLYAPRWIPLEKARRILFGNHALAAEELYKRAVAGEFSRFAQI